MVKILYTAGWYRGRGESCGARGSRIESWLRRSVFRYELIWKVVAWGVMVVWRWGSLKFIEIWKYFFLIEKCNHLHICRPVQFQTLILALIDVQNQKKIFEKSKFCLFRINQLFSYANSAHLLQKCPYLLQLA